jgi:hypothetical protein
LHWRRLARPLPSRESTSWLPPVGRLIRERSRHTVYSGEHWHEIIQEVTLAIFEVTYRLVNDREAVRAATRTINRMYPTLGAPVSLDASMFGDGPALIERISEGLW